MKVNYTFFFRQGVNETKKVENCRVKCMCVVRLVCPLTAFNHMIDICNGRPIENGLHNVCLAPAVPYAFVCNVPRTSRTLLFSDKVWVYIRHYLLDYNDFSIVR